MENTMIESKKWDAPIGVDAVTLAFPAGVIGQFMPKEEELPKEFLNYKGSPFIQFIEEWFTGQVSVDRLKALKPKAGIDAVKALTQIRACLGSFEPSHEHKIGACAWLMERWFEHEDAKPVS